MNKIFLIIAVALLYIIITAASSCGKDEPAEPQKNPSMPITIPAEGNSWFLTNADSPQIKSYDFESFSWNSTAPVLRTYFRVEGTGELHIGVRAKVSSGSSEIEAEILGKTETLKINTTTLSTTYVTTVEIETPGYYFIDLRGVSRDADEFAEIESVRLGGKASEAGVFYSDEDFFYWGRRGPSVHLSYEIPEEASDVVWFYNEVTVPEDNDVVGSYYMANGFGQGYFGFQVNSDTERRVLFSVWSPYSTDNPEEIPADQRVQLLGKGENVTTNDFGNEGSGGQSYWQYTWKTGNTYRFLLKGEPAGNDKTDYSAYFYAPELGQWKFIASWRRPKTNTYLTNQHSFLENFATSTGPIVRKAHYNNQWVYDTNENWHELTKAKFTADNTARSKARLDYDGGYDTEAGAFFLRNCGFFTETAPIDTYHTRPALGTPPNINFEALPAK